MLRILGIDPGKRGGLAVLGCDEQRPELPPQVVGVVDVPIDGDDIDVPVYLAWLRSTRPDRAYVENVQPMPSREEVDEQGVVHERRGMGATSAFNYGGACKVLRAIPWALGIKPMPVTAQVWKKPFGLRGGLPKADFIGGKEQARLYAIERFPEVAYRLERVKDHQRAEALLIALYGVLMITGRLIRPLKLTKAQMVDPDLFSRGG